MKVGLIGAGYWGKNLLRNFYELGVLEIVCETNEEIIKERKKDYPELKFTSDINEILKDEEINAVVIATPAVTHYEIAKLCLKSKKDVFVEKPLALKVEEGEELVKISENEKRILFVGHILQYHPAVIKLKELIDKGELGKINYIYSNRLNIGKLRSEENILWSFAPHDISVILMLVNDFPEEISAVGKAYLQQNIYDVTLTSFNFKNGVSGHIFVSWLHPIKEQKLVVVGSKKMAVFDETNEKKLLLYPHRIEWQKQIPVAIKAEPEIVEIEKIEPLKNECLNFIECVKTRKIPKTDGYEALKVLKFLKIAEDSIKSNGIFINAKKSDYYAHPTAVIDEGAEIGKGTKIWHFSHIMKGAKIGENCIIGQNVYIDKKAVVGNRVKIQNNVSVYDNVILEDEVFCGPSCVFTNVINPRSHIERKSEYKTTLVKRRATIGANATIVCGHTIGEGAFIGAGAVVTKDIPDYALAVGNPARIVGYMCECGIKLEFKDNKATCKACGLKYVMKYGKVIKVN